MKILKLNELNRIVQIALKEANGLDPHVIFWVGDDEDGEPLEVEWVSQLKDDKELMFKLVNVNFEE